MSNKKNASASVFAHRKVDACVAIEVRADGLILLDFLAKGRSQRREGGKVVGYTKRNPERTQLAKHILEALDDDGALFVASSCRGQVSEFGSTMALSVLDAVRSSHSQAGNFRWSLYVRTSKKTNTAKLAEQLGLVERKHRPVKTSWPKLVASLVVALTSVLAA